MVKVALKWNLLVIRIELISGLVIKYFNKFYYFNKRIFKNIILKFGYINRRLGL
jgi:hypothetical protein